MQIIFKLKINHKMLAVTSLRMDGRMFKTPKFLSR